MLNIHCTTKVPASGSDSCLTEYPQNTAGIPGNEDSVRLGENTGVHMLSTKWADVWEKNELKAYPSQSGCEEHFVQYG